MALEYFTKFTETWNLSLGKDLCSDYSIFEPVFYEGVFAHAYRFLYPARGVFWKTSFHPRVQQKAIIEAYDNALVSLYTFNNNMISFRNGVYCLETATFSLHRDVAEHLNSRCYFETVFPLPLTNMPTPFFDRFLVNPVGSEYAKIGDCIRGLRKRVLFIIAPSFDDWRPLRNILQFCFHHGDTETLDYQHLKRKRQLTVPEHRRSNVLLQRFENEVLADALLDEITVAVGSQLPSHYNKDRVDILRLNGNMWGYTQGEYMAEIPALVHRSVSESLGVCRM